MARFFIDRPVFAIVIAIVIVLLGGIAIPGLPVATYPEVVPPVVQITANYRGGNALDLEKTVAQPIEQQLTGVDGMTYFLSRSSNNGALTIDVTFELGTNIDLATVKVQNKVSVALPQLPQEVQREGVTVKKVSSAFLYAIAISSTDARYDALFLNNFATINLVDKIGSLPGVGDCRLAASQNYGMPCGSIPIRWRNSASLPPTSATQWPRRTARIRRAPSRSRRPIAATTSNIRSTPRVGSKRPSSSTTSSCARSPTARCSALAISGMPRWARRITPASAAITDAHPRSSSFIFHRARTPLKPVTACSST